MLPLLPGVVTVYVSLVLSVSFAPGVQESNQERDLFAVHGRVIDEQGNPVENSTVIPLAENGVPLSRTRLLPVTFGELSFNDDEDFLLTCRTDGDGRFQFELPPGTYRFTAQSWPQADPVGNVLDKNGNHLRIDGLAKISFDNETEAAEEIEIKPAGNAEVMLSSQEAGDVVLISTEPLACDIAVGFLAFGGDFWSGVIAGTRMERKQMLISGLPSGKIQFLSFVNDNNGGAGATLADISTVERNEVYVGVLAGWSNGHKTPPEHLTELTKFLLDNADELERVNRHWMEVQSSIGDIQELAREMQMEKMYQLLPRLRDDFELSNGRKVSLGDAVAAAAYARMQKK